MYKAYTEEEFREAVERVLNDLAEQAMLASNPGVTLEVSKKRRYTFSSEFSSCTITFRSTSLCCAHAIGSALRGSEQPNKRREGDTAADSSLVLY